MSEEEKNEYYRKLVEFEALVKRYGVWQVVNDLYPSIRTQLYQALGEMYVK